MGPEEDRVAYTDVCSLSRQWLEPNSMNGAEMSLQLRNVSREEAAQSRSMAVGWSSKEVLSGDPEPNGDGKKREPGLGRHFDIFIRDPTVGLKTSLLSGNWTWEISLEAWSFGIRCRVGYLRG